MTCLTNKSNHQKDSKFLPSLETFFLVVLVLLALFFRFYHLGSESLWIDELLDWGLSKQISLSELYEKAARTAQVPTYYLFFRLYTNLLGDTETILRFLPALTGTLSLPLLYLLTTRLYNTQAGLLAVSLAVPSQFLIWHSQEFRPYSFLFFFSILTVYLLTRLLKPPYRKSDFIFYSITFIVLSQLHHFGFFFASIQFFFLALSGKINIKGLSILFLSLLTLAIINFQAMFFMAYYTLTDDLSDYLKLFPTTLTGSLASYWTSFFKTEFYVLNLAFLTLHIGAPLWLLRVSFKKHILTSEHRKLLILLCWAFASLILFWLIQGAYKDFGFPPKYLIFCQPALYILSGHYLQGLIPNRIGVFLVIILITIHGCYQLIYLDRYYLNTTKTPVRQAVYELSHKVELNQAEVLVNGAPGASLYYYLQDYPVNSVDNLIVRNHEERTYELIDKNYRDYAARVILIETTRNKLGELWKSEIVDLYKVQEISLEKYPVFRVYVFDRLAQ